MTDTATMVALGEDYPELRESVRKICERYPGAYWRKLEAEQAYPTEFITELRQGGFLASLIPEEYGGSGLPLRAAAVILEAVNASGCTASQCHAQMYIMGTLLRHGSEEQKQRYLPKIATGELRLQAFGVTEPTTGSDTTKLKTRAVRGGNECGADANMAKLLASEATWHAADATFQTYGGFAFAKEYDIERKWREGRIYQTAPISTNLILAYLGQHVLGMPRSY